MSRSASRSRARRRTAIKAEVDELLSKMGLLPAAKKYPAQLSGGMQQRVQIARSLAQRPKIILMDEPFGALDAITRQTLQDELQTLARERNMTVVFITHDLEEALYLGDTRHRSRLESRPDRQADRRRSGTAAAAAADARKLDLPAPAP